MGKHVFWKKTMETPYVFLDKPLKTWAKHVLFKENHMENIGKPEIL